MTVPANDRLAGPYACTGGETLLAYDFRILAAEDLAVLRLRGGGVERLALSLHYTLAGVGSASGGNVTLVEGAIADDEYLLLGDRPAVRTADLAYNRALPPATFNAEFDSLQIQVAEMRHRTDRAVVRAPFSSSSESLELPLEPGYLMLNEDGGLSTDPDGGGGGGGGGPELPVSVENGGTGADDPGEARANLGLGDLAILDAVPVWLVDGAPLIGITDRLTSPPTSVSGGTLRRRYIINGAPTGVWLSGGFVQHDIAEENGSGGWVKRTPAEGWFAYVADEQVLAIFKSGAWVDQVGMAAPLSSTLQAAVFEHQLANGTAGGNGSAGGWVPRVLNTSVSNTITGCSLASNRVTLLPGTYYIAGWQALAQTHDTQSRITVISGAASPTSIFNSLSRNYGIDSGGNTPGTIAGAFSVGGILTVTATALIEFQYWVTASSGGANTLGFPSAEPGNSPEVYAHLSIISLAALQGPQGAQGSQGNTGAGYGGASTTSRAIGTGSKTFTLTEAGYAYAVGSRVRAVSAASPTVNWMEGYVTSYSGTTLTLNVDTIGGSGTLADWLMTIAGIVPAALINDLNGAGYSIGNVVADNDVITATGSLTAAMSGTVQVVNAASNVTLTMPNSLPVGWTCTFIQIGSGQAIFAAASGATINNRQGDDRTHSQWAMAVLTVTGNGGGSAAVAVLGGDTA